MSWWAMVAIMINKNISLGVPPGYLSSLKHSIDLPFSLEPDASVLSEHISATLLFVVPPDLPLGFDGLMGPPVMAATNGLLPGFLPSSPLSASLSSITSTLFLGDVFSDRFPLGIRFFL
ncbi:hypothetical protein A2U01_0048145, partial [Trifolium medium]|nr:hypothetical protein [Trifolium medium]